MLKAIEDAGEIAQCDLARENAVAVETLSRRLGALRRKGLVTARTGKNHGEQIYSLTDEGKKILETSRPYWERAQARLRRTMGEKEWQLVFELSDRIVSATQQAEEMRIVNSTAAKPDAVLLQQ
jgi:DNA-binding MarR family transcriptional regulator